MKKTLLLLLSGTFLLLGADSCKKELFDSAAYNEFVDYQFMIDNLDREHDWQLVKSATLFVKAPGNVYNVQVLTEDPNKSARSEIAANAVCYSNEAELSYTIPITQQQLYLAALNQNGQYIGVVPFNYGEKEVDLNNVTMQNTGFIALPTPQTFTYLYEANFPEPGDFDYNDVVLRINKSYTDASNQVLLTVTLEAVGTQKQVAAAIHLGGFSYEDVLSVEITDGEQMDINFPMPRNMLGSGDVLLRGRNGEAVIGLFEDGHWAMTKNKESDGSIMRKILNTTRNETEYYSSIVPTVTKTYCINFKSRELARQLTFENIDPFILEEYNGGIWEVHTYSYKFNDVLKNIFRGNASAYDNHVSWCVVVPKNDFRYPVEGMSLGTYSKETGGLFGPYDGFVYWMQDHNSNTDWYLKPTRAQLLY